MIVERCYLLRGIPGAPETVLAVAFQIPFQLSRCASPMEHIIRKYRDRGIDLADAYLI